MREGGRCRETSANACHTCRFLVEVLPGDPSAPHLSTLVLLIPVLAVLCAGERAGVADRVSASYGRG